LLAIRLQTAGGRTWSGDNGRLIRFPGSAATARVTPVPIRDPIHTTGAVQAMGRAGMVATGTVTRATGDVAAPATPVTGNTAARRLTGPAKRPPIERQAGPGSLMQDPAHMA